MRSDFSLSVGEGEITAAPKYDAISPCLEEAQKGEA